MADIKVELLIILKLEERFCDYHNEIFFNNFIKFVKDKIMSFHAKHKKLDIISDDMAVYLSRDNFCSLNEKSTVTGLIRNELMNYFNQYSESIDEITFELIETISGTGLDLN